ncbi:MAG TPA: tetratricopeptide repeat protein, partial [Clostridia bacterium]|nr:tetratricopeptide repeat protein [Clostridia bacterium]
WHLRRGEFTVAEPCFRKAIQRLTGRNANPYDGEPYYNLGLCLRHLGRDDEAYDALYKATWNQSWAGAAYHALAEIDCARATWTIALDHLTHALRFNTDNTRARNLQVMVLRKLGGIHLTEAARLLQQNRALDPLDWWARYLDSQPLACDLQTQLDLAHDFARAGLYAEAVQLLDAGSQANGKPHLPHAENGSTLPTLSWGASPLTEYTLGWLYEKLNDPVAAKRHFKAASELSPDYCFPARLQEIAILQTAIQAQPKDPRAPYYLGNLFYDRRRHEEAIDLWEISARLDPSFSVVWRNLGIGYFNIRKQPAKARQAYEKAFRSNPTDARLLFERDQLWKRLGVKPVKRLRELQKHPAMVQQRDDLSIELCALFNQTGSHTQAASIIQSRRFQPWEGGEGGPLGQHVRSHLALGRLALAAGDAATARDHFQTALTAPFNLGEARHLLANQSDLHFWLGCALKDLGQAQAANEQWLAAATAKGDFLEMSVRTFSEMTYYSALAWNRLGRKAKAEKIFRDLLAYAKILRRSVAKIDYFATSLPTMLLFDDDLQRRQQITAMFLQAQALIGLRRKKQAAALLRSILQRDPNHALAADLIKEVTS